MGLFGTDSLRLSLAEPAAEALVVSFDTTTSAFALKSCAEAYGLQGRLIPVPRALSAGCGMAWREPLESRAQVEEALEREGIEYAQAVVMRA